MTALRRHHAQLRGRISLHKEKLKNTLANTCPATARPSCASPRPRSTPTSPSSSTAAWRQPYPGEDRILIPSPKVATYDLKPEMSAYEVRRQVVQAHRERQVRRDHPELRQLRHGGPHRVSTRPLSRPCEAVDTCVAQVVAAVLNMGGCAFITADHGNAER